MVMVDARSKISEAPGQTVRRRERTIFVFLAIFLMPVLAVAIVGGYGLAVWMYQLLAGPPTG